MVHELHKAGYQHLRVCAGYSYDGSEWRCHILTSNDVLGDGWTPAPTIVPHEYSSSSGTRYFGWDDAQTDDARMLAVKFIERFPETAQSSVGEDWPYAGWFTLTIGAAENGRLPAFYSGTDLEPPEPTFPLPPPPSGTKVPNNLGGTGQPLIANEKLSLGDLPPPGADYERLWPFCLAFDGYRSCLRTVKDCEYIANLTEREGLENATLERLRVTAFIRQRAIKWGDQWPPDAWLLNSIRAVIEEIRRRLKLAINR